MLSSLDTTGIKFRFDSGDVIRGETDFTGNTYHCDSGQQLKFKRLNSFCGAKEKEIRSHAKQILICNVEIVYNLDITFYL